MFYSFQNLFEGPWDICDKMKGWGGGGMGVVVMAWTGEKLKVVLTTD